MKTLVVARVDKEDDKYVMYETSTGARIPEPVLFVTRRRAFDGKYLLQKVWDKSTSDLRWKPLKDVLKVQDYQPLKKYWEDPDWYEPTNGKPRNDKLLINILDDLENELRVEPVKVKEPVKLEPEFKEPESKVESKITPELPPEPYSEKWKFETVKNAFRLIPKNLVIDELNWKLAVNGALRGSNILLLGNSGCGKTLTAYSLAEQLGHPFFKFNMGAM